MPNEKEGAAPQENRPKYSTQTEKEENGPDLDSVNCGGSLEPDASEISKHFDLLYRHADYGTFLTIRSFAGPKVFKIEAHELSDNNRGAIVSRAVTHARLAANAPERPVVCPPVATYLSANGAAEPDLANGLALSVELDIRPREGLKKLRQLFNAPTAVVESGGEWANPETGEIEPKLHVHFRLNEPTRCKEDHERLKRLRRLATFYVGADATNVPVVHPLRLPGTWHLKGEPRLCRIVEESADAEIDLDDALEALEGIVEDIPPPSPNSRVSAPAADDAPLADIMSGQNYHESIARLAAKYVKTGMHPGAVVNLLRELMESNGQTRDERWRDRYDDIPRAVSTAEAKYAADKEGDPEPVDIFARHEPPALPSGLLPSVIENFARERGGTTGADVSGFAMAALAVCSAAIPDRIRVRVKRHDNWEESARLWVMLVGEPSTRKTPILRAAESPLAKINSALVRQYEAMLDEYEALDPKVRRGRRPPPQRRHILNDVTVEAAQGVLRDSPEGLLLHGDEMSGWLGSMERYGNKGASADRAFWLKSFDGGSYEVIRVGRGSVSVPNLSVSILGGIQPEKVREAAAQAADDGLIQRFFPVHLRDAEMGQDAPTGWAVEEYDVLVAALTRLHGMGGVLGFDDAAQVVQREVASRLHKMTVPIQTVNRKLASHIGKFPGLFARLCVLWHAIENAPNEPPPLIPAEVATRVRDFMFNFILPHSASFYTRTLGLGDDHDDLADLAGVILSEKLEFVHHRTTQRAKPTLRALTSDQSRVLFEKLEAFGWLTPIDPPRRSASPRWAVNPRVHEMFEQRGKDASKHRAQARAQIMAIFGSQPIP